MTLYLKYRPRNLDELDLPEVSESLKKIVSKKSIPHAFLFAGPKGTGKTSAARILAKIINCTNLKDGKPCDKCGQCTSITDGSNLDVIEMDAASHRGIDDVRILRDAVKLSPVSATKKIYIIDEAHMLTTEASNALLKTLEEPPEHVVFILATTNPEKLIETIRSRTTYIPFRKAGAGEIVRSLKRVVTGEKIKIDDDTLKIIAEASGGSFRDGIKILEQLVAEEKELTHDFLEEYLFKKKDFDLEKFTALLIKKDTKSLIENIGNMSTKGVTIEIFLEALLKKLRKSLLAKVGVGEDETKEIEKNEIIRLIELLSEALQNISTSPIEELPLEMAVVKWCEENGDGLPSTHADQNSLSASGKTASARSHSQTASEPQFDSASQDLALPERMSIDDGIWRDILNLIKPINASIEALLRAAKPVAYDGKILTLGVFYKFHKERLEDIRHKKILEDIVTKVLQAPTRIFCTLVEPPPKKIVEEAKVDTVLTEGSDRDIIKAAEEIFGN